MGLLTRPSKILRQTDNLQVLLSVAGFTVRCETKSTDKPAVTFVTDELKKAFSRVVKRLYHLDVKRWPKKYWSVKGLSGKCNN